MLVSFAGLIRMERENTMIVVWNDVDDPEIPVYPIPSFEKGVLIHTSGCYYVFLGPNNGILVNCIEMVYFHKYYWEHIIPSDASYEVCI